MKRIIVAGFFIFMLFHSCRHSDLNTAVVNGIFADAKGLKLILQEIDTHAIHSVDSVVSDENGMFSFYPVIREAGFWLLKAPSGKILVLLMNAGDQIELSGSAHDFPENVVLEGPVETRLLNDFFRQTRHNENLVDSLEMLLSDRQDSPDFYQFTRRLDTSFRQIWESQRNYEMAFINKNPGSLASLVVLNYAFGMSPVLSPKDDFLYYQRVDSSLYANFPDNKHVKLHHQRLEEIRHKK